VTRQPAAGPEKGSIATLGGAGLAVCRHVRRVSRTAPTLGVRSPCAAVTLGPASSQLGSGQRAAPGEDVLLRLALWLAEVAGEAALTATVSTASSMPGLSASRSAGEADDPPVVESPP
jgi:hypothetical protein